MMMSMTSTVTHAEQTQDYKGIGALTALQPHDTGEPFSMHSPAPE
jgi:hypothetical protein